MELTICLYLFFILYFYLSILLVNSIICPFTRVSLTISVELPLVFAQSELQLVAGVIVFLTHLVQVQTRNSWFHVSAFSGQVYHGFLKQDVKNNSLV